MRWLTAEEVMWSASAAALNEPLRAASSKACSASSARAVRSSAASSLF
jgi:hypothetical protein